MLGGMRDRSTPHVSLVSLAILLYGWGFALFLLSLLKPALFVEYKFLALLVDLWGFAVVVGVGYLIYRLRKSDEENAKRRKDKYDKGWQQFEDRKARGQRVREASYRGEEIMQKAKAAQIAARREAEERRGVEVVFGTSASDESKKT